MRITVSSCEKDAMVPSTVPPMILLDSNGEAVHQLETKFPMVNHYCRTPAADDKGTRCITIDGAKIRLWSERT